MAENTLDLQTQLPSLPLPSLEATCKKYLESVKPFVTEDEYLSTEFKVEMFQNGVGKELQKKLKELSENSRNWLQDYWYDTYLDYRGSNPMISNISGGYESISDFDAPQLGCSISRIANWIHSMATVFLRIIRQKLPMQLLGKQFPMDMTQFLNFFCGGRLPGEKRDIQVHGIRTFPKPDGKMEVVCNIQHIVLLMKGRIFYMKIFDDNNILLHPESIKRQIEEVVECCNKLGEGPSVAALTASKRDDWYKAYKHLCILDRQNKINVDLINDAIFAVAIEDVETYNLQQTCEHGILGGPENRWFDKSCQAIVGKTGVIVTTEDHIHFDGNVGCQILQYCADYLIEHKFAIEPGYIQQKPDNPIELKFIIDKEIKDYIRDACKLHKTISSYLGIIDRPIESYGKKFAKNVKINPDTIIQMAIQLSVYSLHNRFFPTYESATSRIYYNGRTETLRSCTMESKAWCESMLNPNKTNLERLDLLQKAARKHDRLMMEACQGKGIDRHLLVLKKMCEEQGLPIPEMYLDKAYKMSGGDGNFTISSSLTGFTVLHGGLSPMVEDGYGIFYSINNERSQFVISSWKTCNETDHEKLHQTIISSLDKIRDLFALAKL